MYSHDSLIRIVRLHVADRPLKRKRTGTPIQAYRDRDLHRATPRDNPSQLDSDNTARETEDTNSKFHLQSIRVRWMTHNVTLSVVHSLPPELLSAIVEQLWDDGRTLGAFALVCSAWRAAARPFIYRKIVIRNTQDMTRLAHQIQYEPRIAYWIRTICFEGKSVPRSGFPLSGAIGRTIVMDIDTWIYPFFSIIGTHLPNVKKFELFGFLHLSLRREDCQAFAEWILELSHLDSVESLHLARCEMPPNALTAIIRSFPRLRDVALTCVGCRVSAPAGVDFVGLSVVSPGSAHTSK